MSTQKIVVRPYEPFEDIGGSTSLAEGKAHADLFFQKFPEMSIKTRFGVAPNSSDLQQWFNDNSNRLQEKLFTPDEIKEILSDKEVDFIWVARALRGNDPKKDEESAIIVVNYLKTLKSYSANLPTNFKAKPIMGFCGSLAAMLPLEDLGLAIPVHGPFGYVHWSRGFCTYINCTNEIVSTMSTVKPGETTRISTLFKSWKASNQFSVVVGALEPLNDPARHFTSGKGYVYGGLVEFVAQSIENRTNKLNDAILFVEAIETQSIENAAKNLVQMALDGKYGIKALLFGDIKLRSNMNKLQEIWELAGTHGIPVYRTKNVFAGLSIGHLGWNDNIPVPFGCATLSKTDKVYQLIYDHDETQKLMQANRAAQKN